MQHCESAQWICRKTRAAAREDDQQESATEAALARIAELEKELDSKEVPFDCLSRLAAIKQGHMLASFCTDLKPCRQQGEHPHPCR